MCNFGKSAGACRFVLRSARCNDIDSFRTATRRGSSLRSAPILLRHLRLVDGYDLHFVVGRFNHGEAFQHLARSLPRAVPQFVAKLKYQFDFIAALPFDLDIAINPEPAMWPLPIVANQVAPNLLSRDIRRTEVVHAFGKEFELRADRVSKPCLNKCLNIIAKASAGRRWRECRRGGWW